MTRFSRVIDESPPAKTLYLGAHTIVRMNPQQIVGMGLRNARERLVPRLPVDFDRRYERRVPADPPVSIDVLADNAAVLRDSLASVERRRHRTNARNVADGTMTLMNRSVSIEGGDSIDWYEDRFDEQSSLWRLKLYAFEWLGAAALGFEPSASEEAVRDALDALIGGWVESVDVGGERYLRRHWTPWSVSLRIQHWLRYLAWRRESADGMSPDAEAAFRREIYKNACFLRNHVEWDVGGNHLVENGAALLMAGIAFESVETDWIETGLSILESVADQQFLDDGCHFERSPMYHALVLTRYLTTQDLLERTGRPVPTSVRTVTAEATDFLRRLRPPDGRIPLLNDSVYGEAHSLDACLRYAGAVGVGRIEVRSDVPGTIREVPPTVSGYEWLRTDAGAMLVDGGPTGPPHLPGHGHSDTLGILLWIGDRPVITDTGTFDYVDGPRREYARGVRGHNTV
ncbi:MAG: heparinase II/III domain-containing protein, partial [Halobacteriota archaeon]